jgi:hypothetical protein
MRYFQAVVNKKSVFCLMLSNFLYNPTLQPPFYLFPLSVILNLARMFHESPAATADSANLPGVLGCRALRRTVKVRLGTNTLRLPGGSPVFAVSRQQFMKYPG